MIDFIFKKLTKKNVNKKQKLILNKLFKELYTFEIELEPPTSYTMMLGAICGNNYHQSMASSINLFGVRHGPIGKAVNFIQNLSRPKNISNNFNKPYFGFGHPKYKDEDPRTLKMLEYCNRIGYTNLYLKKALKFQKKCGKPLNIGGFTACILLECGCNSDTADYFPLISRMLGLTLIYAKTKAKKLKLQDARYVHESYYKSLP